MSRNLKNKSMWDALSAVLIDSHWLKYFLYMSSVNCLSGIDSFPSLFLGSVSNSLNILAHSLHSDAQIWSASDSTFSSEEEEMLIGEAGRTVGAGRQATAGAGNCYVTTGRTTIGAGSCVGTIFGCR